MNQGRRDDQLRGSYAAFAYALCGMGLAMALYVVLP
jgi:hypothetical protein